MARGILVTSETHKKFSENVDRRHKTVVMKCFMNIANEFPKMVYKTVL